MNHFKRLLVSCMLVSVVGCAESVRDRDNSYVEVSPVDYLLNIKIKDKKAQQAQQQLDQFITEHWNDVVEQKVTLYWATSTGKNVIDKTYAELLNKGVNVDNLTREPFKVEDKAHYDFGINLRTYHVQVPVCEYTTIQKYGFNADGCNVEGNRWLSLSHPERAIENQELLK